MLSYTWLYLIFVLTALALFNALIVLARFSRQIKDPPMEEDYVRLEETRKQLEDNIAKQNAEMVDLQMQLEDLEKSLKATQEAQSESQQA